MERTKIVTMSLIGIVILAIVITLICRPGSLIKQYPCQSFLPDHTYGPGNQCSNDRRAYLKIYENGNAVCVCKDQNE